MAQYIDKDVLLAEIERRFLEDYNTDDVEMDEVAQGVLASLKYFIDTLEVKGVDLEKEFFDWCHEEKNRDYNASILYERYGIISKKLAKHFFELGLKTKGE